MNQIKHQTHKRHLVRCTLVAAGLTVLAISLSGCQEGLGGGARSGLAVSILPDTEAEGVDLGGSAAQVEVAGYGTLKGRVILEGSAPNLPPTIQQSQIKSQDVGVCLYEKIPRQTNFIVASDGALANVFVYLSKAPPGTKLPEGEASPIEFDQEFCTFKPHCLVALAGQTIMVLNSDSILHNTHTYPTRNPGFNSGVDKASGGIPLVYERPENKPVKVVCDIHPWMGAYHLPLDHPYGALTGDDGTFEITDIPAGKHLFTVWHEVAGDIKKRYEVEITVDGTTEVEIKAPAADFASFDGERSKRVILSVIP